MLMSVYMGGIYRDGAGGAGRVYNGERITGAGRGVSKNGRISCLTCFI